MHHSHVFHEHSDLVLTAVKLDTLMGLMCTHFLVQAELSGKGRWAPREKRNVSSDPGREMKTTIYYERGTPQAFSQSLHTEREYGERDLGPTWWYGLSTEESPKETLFLGWEKEARCLNCVLRDERQHHKHWSSHLWHIGTLGSKPVTICCREEGILFYLCLFCVCTS